MAVVARPEVTEGSPLLASALEPEQSGVYDAGRGMTRHPSQGWRMLTALFAALINVFVPLFRAACADSVPRAFPRRIPGFITGEGWGNSRGEAELAAEKNANENLARLGTGIYKRHCKFKCEQR